jgi:hypothetical protein
MQLVKSPRLQPINEDLLRRFAGDNRATAAGCAQLAAFAQARERRLNLKAVPHIVHGTHEAHVLVWTLVKANGDEGARVRCDRQDGVVLHYAGEKGEERLTRVVKPNACEGAYTSKQTTFYYEGPRGAEVKRREEYADGTIVHFDGEKDRERVVRAEHPDGHILHYTGERGHERRLRAEGRNGKVVYFEGPKGHEAKRRQDRPDGTVAFYEGPKGDERKVREDHPDGRVFLFGGPKGAEKVREMGFASLEQLREEKVRERFPGIPLELLREAPSA